jgi:hypothetical protein
MAKHYLTASAETRLHLARNHNSLGGNISTQTITKHAVNLITKSSFDETNDQRPTVGTSDVGGRYTSR